MAVVQQVLFRLGSQEYGMDIFHVEAIERDVPIVRIPGAPKNIAGIMHLRGESIPVYDLHARFGIPGGMTSGSTNLVVIARVRGMKLALAVDEVSEILAAEEKEVLTAPELVLRQETSYISRVTNAKGHMFISLSPEELITEEDKRQLEKLIRDSKQDEEA